MRWNRAAAAAGAICATLGVAACSPSTHASSTAPLAARAAPAAAPSGAGTVNGRSAGGGAASTVGDLTLSSPALIQVAGLQITVAKATGVDAAANRAGQIALAAGGSVFGDDRSSGHLPRAVLTLKVPNAKLAGVLLELDQLGTETARSLSTQDVTSQVVDVSSRVTSAKAAIAQLDKLYARAVNVSDVIAIATTLSQREADLESLEAQQHTLLAQTAMATIQLTLAAPATPPRAHHHPTTGFLAGWWRGWHAFTTSIALIATSVGAALPFAAVFAALFGAAFAVRRRHRRLHGAPVPSAVTEPTGPV